MSKLKVSVDLIKFHASDVGSSAVQIHSLTEQILHLSNHCKKNPKDLHSRRGLVKKISLRRKLMKYFKRTSLESYLELILKLNIRDSV